MSRKLLLKKLRFNDILSLASNCEAITAPQAAVVSLDVPRETIILI